MFILISTVLSSRDKMEKSVWPSRLEFQQGLLCWLRCENKTIMIPDSVIYHKFYLLTEWFFVHLHHIMVAWEPDQAASSCFIYVKRGGFNALTLYTVYSLIPRPVSQWLLSLSRVLLYGRFEKKRLSNPVYKAKSSVTLTSSVLCHVFCCSDWL